MRFSLLTINTILNLLLLALVVDVSGSVDPDGKIVWGSTYLKIRTVFSVGYVYNWPHIRLLTWLGL